MGRVIVMTTEYDSALGSNPSPSRRAYLAVLASQPQIPKSQYAKKLPQVPAPVAGAKAPRNPNVWSAADLVLTQRTNALFPHPDSQVAKQLKAHSAVRMYGKLNAITSTL